MAKRDVEKERVRISTAPSPDSSIKQLEDVVIVVTQAFCPEGHNLIGELSADFDGYPGIHLEISDGRKTGAVDLSPFHGDDSKKGDLDWEKGARLEVRCPICKTPLPRMARCNCETKDGRGGDLVKLYLTPKLEDSHAMALCNIWGCRQSRTIDNWQIISEFLEGQIES